MELSFVEVETNGCERSREPSEHAHREFYWITFLVESFRNIWKVNYLFRHQFFFWVKPQCGLQWNQSSFDIDIEEFPRFWTNYRVKELQRKKENEIFHWNSNIRIYIKLCSKFRPFRIAREAIFLLNFGKIYQKRKLCWTWWTHDMSSSSNQYSN